MELSGPSATSSSCLVDPAVEQRQSIHFVPDPILRSLLSTASEPAPLNDPSPKKVVPTGISSPEKAPSNSFISSIWAGLGRIRNTVLKFFTLGNENDASRAAQRARACSELHARQSEYMTLQQLNIAVCTWNVASKAPPPSLREWLLQTPSPSGDQPLPDIVAVGLQEAEVGGTALIMELTDTCVTWLEAITDCLNEAAHYKFRYVKIGIVQLVGIVLILVARKDHVPHIYNIMPSVHRMGAISGVLGNKGSVGLRATIYGKRVLFICAHFAAHKGKQQTRNSNYHSTMADLQIKIPEEWEDNVALALREVSASTGFGANDLLRHHSMLDRFFSRKSRGDAAIGNEASLLNSFDYIFFFGDLNYRISRYTYPDAVKCIESGKLTELFQYDELHEGLEVGEIFDGFREPRITFPPTYKFEMGTDRYDKKRVPAWTDRILYRTRRAAFSPPTLEALETSKKKDNDLTFNRTTVLELKCAQLLVSDHLPVSCHFRIAALNVDPQAASRLLVQLKCMRPPRTEANQGSLDDEAW